MTLCKSGTWVKSICCIELMVILYLMSQNGNLYCGHNDLCFIFFIPLWLMSVSFSWPSIYYSVEPLLLFFTAFIKLSSIFSSTHSCCRFFGNLPILFLLCKYRKISTGTTPCQSGTSPLYVVSIHDALPGARWENVPKKRADLETCCHHRWQTVCLSQLPVITFVSQPHDITPTVCPDGVCCSEPHEGIIITKCTRLIPKMFSFLFHCRRDCRSEILWDSTSGFVKNAERRMKRSKSTQPSPHAPCSYL